MVKNFAFVVYAVTDLARSRAFYCDLLGLKELGCWQENWLELKLGDGALVLTTRCGELGIMPGAKGAIVALEVEDLDGLVETLDTNVEWSSRPAEFAYCRAGTVTDPDGNRLLFHQAKSARAPLSPRSD